MAYVAEGTPSLFFPHKIKNRMWWGKKSETTLRFKKILVYVFHIQSRMALSK